MFFKGGPIKEDKAVFETRNNYSSMADVCSYLCFCVSNTQSFNNNDGSGKEERKKEKEVNVSKNCPGSFQHSSLSKFWHAALPLPFCIFLKFHTSVAYAIIL